MIFSRQEFKDCFGVDVLEILKELAAHEDPNWLMISFGEDKMKPFVIGDYTAESVTLNLEYSKADLKKHYRDLRNKWLGV